MQIIQSFRKGLGLTLAVLMIGMLAAGCKESQPSNPSAACKTLRGPGTPSKHANIVFVPSGFSGDWAAFQHQAEKVLTVMNQYTPFERLGSDPRTPANAFLVEKEHGTGFCNFGCGGIDRLLCCNVSVSKSLSAECTSGPRQTVVIHNDLKYGGGGATAYDIATTSIEPSAPHIAAHELGHSFFNLGDEYTVGTSTNTFPNCDAAGCHKWADLLTAGFTGVTCDASSCAGGAYFASSVSIMRQLGMPYLPVNERLSCCEYHNVTGVWPSYCDKFTGAGLSLATFCTTHLRGTSIYIAHPIWIELDHDVIRDTWKMVRRTRLTEGRYFPRRLVTGDGGGDFTVRVTAGGVTRTLAYAAQVAMEYAGPTGELSQSTLSGPRKALQFVVDLAPEQAAGGATVAVSWLVPGGNTRTTTIRVQ